MTFPEMIKKKYEMAEEEAWKVLREGVYGVLSTLSPNGYCYGVPLHHAVVGKNLYFHGSPKDGHKLEAMKHHPQVSYVTVDSRMQILDGKMDTRYTSACVFGTVSPVTEKEEKAAAMLAIVEKYDPASLEKIRRYAEGEMPVGVWKIQIESISGKSSYLEGDV